MPELVSTWNAFKYHWFVWKYTGLIPPPQGHRYRYTYIALAILLHLCITILFPTTFVVNCFKSNDLRQFCENLYIAITDIACNIKTLFVFALRHKLKAVRPVLEYLDSKAQSEKEQGILKDAVRSAKVMFLTLIRIFATACLLAPVVSYLASKPTLLYPAWFPWDWGNSQRVLFYTNLFQFCGLCLQGSQDAANDTYPQAYIRILSGHLRALSVRVENIGQGVEIDKISKKQQVQNHKELKECIRQHQIIIELFQTIQAALSNACMVQFVCTTLAQCTIGVYVLYMELQYSQMLNVALFFVAVTLEPFILCYFGEMLCQESEQLCQAIYNCNWICQSVEFKKDLLFFLRRSQRINVIIVFKFIPLRLPTFVMIIKTAYSVFTLLNNMQR